MQQMVTLVTGVVSESIYPTGGYEQLIENTRSTCYTYNTRFFPSWSLQNDFFF
jgi:hypothetical protein